MHEPVAVDRLIALPPELRNAIWELVFLDHDTDIRLPCRTPPILQTSRMLRHEAAAIFYGDRTIGVSTADIESSSLHQWLLAQQAFGLLNQLTKWSLRLHEGSEIRLDFSRQSEPHTSPEDCSECKLPEPAYGGCRLHAEVAGSQIHVTFTWSLAASPRRWLAGARESLERASDQFASAEREMHVADLLQMLRDVGQVSPPLRKSVAESLGGLRGTLVVLAGYAPYGPPLEMLVSAERM